MILRISNIIGFKKKQKNLHSTFVDMFYEKAKKGFIYDNGKKFKDKKITLCLAIVISLVGQFPLILSFYFFGKGRWG